MSWFSAKPNESLVIILEIQSSLVRGSLVLLREKIAPQILFTYSKDVPHKDGVDNSYFIKMSSRAISETVDTILRHLHIKRSDSHDGQSQTLPRKVSAIHYVLSSPWIISQARTVSLSYLNVTKITSAKIDEMLDAERKKLVPEQSANSTSQNRRQATGSPSQVDIIEEKIFDVRLNGYSVSAWHDKEAHELEVSYAISIASRNTIALFRGLCEHVVHAREVYFHSSLLLQHIGLRHVMPNRDAYTLIHVHGELTDVVIVNRNSCVFFGSYPQGVRTIVGKIAKTMKTDEHAADSLLTMYTGHSIDAQHERSIESVVNDIGKGWSVEFGKLISQAGLGCSLPKHAVLGCRAQSEFFLRCFKSAYPETEVELMTADDLSSFVTFDKQAERLRVVGLYSLAINNIQD